jgi:hypothetical protein
MFRGSAQAAETVNRRNAGRTHFVIHADIGQESFEEAYFEE